MNPYEILGISTDATKSQIRLAYRKLAKTLHPDAGGGEAEFEKLKMCYDTLMSDERRQKYDEHGFVDGDPESIILQSALQELHKMFFQALNEIPEDKLAFTDVVLVLNKYADSKMQELEKSLIQLKNLEKIRQKSLQVIKKKLKMRIISKPNFLIAALEQSIAAIPGQIKQLEMGKSIYAEVKKILTEFSYHPDVIIDSNNPQLNNSTQSRMGSIGFIRF